MYISNFRKITFTNKCSFSKPIFIAHQYFLYKVLKFVFEGHLNQHIQNVVLRLTLEWYRQDFRCVFATRRGTRGILWIIQLNACQIRPTNMI